MQVQLFTLVLIAVMGRVVQETVLDTGPGGGRVTATEGDPIQQISAIYITLHATVSGKME